MNVHLPKAKIGLEKINMVEVMIKKRKSYNLRLYSNIPGNRDSVAKNSSMGIENGLTR